MFKREKKILPAAISACLTPLSEKDGWNIILGEQVYFLRKLRSGGVVDG